MSPKTIYTGRTCRSACVTDADYSPGAACVNTDEMSLNYSRCPLVQLFETRMTGTVTSETTVFLVMLGNNAFDIKHDFIVTETGLPQ